jgi:hypothetical protein
MHVSSSPTSRSVWQRSRHWTTASFAGASLVSIALLSTGHHLHGGLMLLGVAVLLRQSLMGRRARRRAAVIHPGRAHEGTRRTPPQVTPR